MKTRSRKAKGSLFEKKVVDFFNGLPNWKARKQPGSGIYSSFPHDVFATLCNDYDYVIECKKWKHGWRTGDKAIGRADMLFIERNFGEPMIYVSARIFSQIPWDKMDGDD